MQAKYVCDKIRYKEVSDISIAPYVNLCDMLYEHTVVL